MKSYLSYAKFFVVVMCLSLTAGCVVNTVTNKYLNPDTILLNCLKAWKTMDYSADTMFRVFGDLHKNGIITDEQVDILTVEGDKLHHSLVMSKEAIMSYLWEKEMNPENFDTLTRISFLVDAITSNIKSYYELRSVAMAIYKETTNGELYVPDVPVVTMYNQ